MTDLGLVIRGRWREISETEERVIAAALTAYAETLGREVPDRESTLGWHVRRREATAARDLLAVLGYGEARPARRRAIADPLAPVRPMRDVRTNGRT